MNKPLRLLLVEDSEYDAFFLLRELEHGGYEVISERVETPGAFVAALEDASWDIVVSDYSVPGFGALPALALLKEKGLDLPFIVVSGKLGEETAVEVMRAGARDYVMKHNLTRLGPAIEREIGEVKARRGYTQQLEALVEELRFNEQVLRESEEHFRATFEQAATGIAHVGLDGRWLRVNQKLCDIVGYACEELLGLTFQEITHPDDLDKDLEKFQQMLDDDIQTYSTEKRYFRKNGSIVWIELTVSLVRAPSGEPKYFISVVEDISERKRAEKELRLRDRAIAASSDGILISDPNKLDNPIIYVNPAFARITGYTSEEAVGRNCRFLQGHDRDQPLLDELRDAVRDARYSTVVLRNYRKDGTLFWNELSLSPIYDENGCLIHLVGVQKDVTERKLTEQRREAQYSVSRILAESASLEEAAPRLLEALGSGLGWELGALWMVDRSAGVLRCGQTWRASSIAAAEFEATTRETSPTPGRGLPGRVWESGKPLWVPDILEDTNFLRSKSAARADLHGAFAFPIRDKGRVLGVIEFFSRRVLSPDEDLPQMVTALGSEIGQFIERKRGEEALRESEERYRVVAETASDTILMIDEDSRILYVNSAAEKVFGYSSEEMLGERLTMLMPERLRRLHREGLKRYVDTGERRLAWELLQLPGLHKSGKEISLETSFGEFIKEGKRYFTGFVRDITERERAEEALRRSEERYRTFIEQSTEAIWCFELEQPLPVNMPEDEQIEWFYRYGYLAECNLAMARMYDFSRPEELVGLRLSDLFPRSAPGTVECLWEFIRSGYRMVDTESREIDRRGNAKNILNNLTGIFENGSLIRAWGTKQDISERRKVEEALRQRQELYRTVVEQAAENIFLVDVETRRIIETNAALYQSLGYTAEEIRHMTLYDIVDHDRESMDRNIQRVLDEGCVFVGERKYRRKDGSVIYVEVSASAILYESSEVMCVVAHEVTERKRMEDDLRRSLGALLALYEAGQILTSSLDLEEIGTRLLKVMQRVSSLTTAVISLLDERQELRVWRAIGFDNLNSRARYAPEVQALLRTVLKTGDHQLLRFKGSKENSRSLVGLCLPIRMQDRSVGLLEIYGPEELLEENALEILGSMSNQAASALENARLYGKLAEREKQLEDLVGKLLRAQEEERRRIAYEIHDGLTQVATATHQRLQTFARRHPQTSEKGGEDLDRILGLAQRTVREARQVVSSLRPVALDDFGLAAALHQEVEELRGDGWRVDYEEELGDERPPAAVETALFRIGQEALTNARKHTRARRAHLKLERRKDDIILEVRDWGRGFDPNALEVGSGPGERVGLSGMRERVGMLDGELEIHSRPGEGTRVTARVPLPALEEGDREDKRNGP